MKRILSIALAAILLLALWVPAFAAEEEEELPAYRLTEVKTYSGGVEDGSTVLVYGDDSAHPSEIHMTGPLTVDAILGYDEAGRLVSEHREDMGFISDAAYTYNDDGDVLEYTYSSTSADGTVTQSKQTSVYDDQGRCVSAVYETNFADGSQKYEYEYHYDGDVQTGFTSTFTGMDGAATVSEVTNTYDDDGNLIESGDSVYTYDEQGKRKTVSTDLGFMKMFTTYYYAPYLECDVTDSDSDGTVSRMFYVNFTYGTNVSESVASISAGEGDPELTFDDNGCLIKADPGNGQYVEFTYEPMA